MEGEGMYDPDIHHRRSIRLADYDYTQAGTYFVTVCMEGHWCLLARVIDGEIRTSDAGDMVQTAWDELPSHYPGVETDAFVVMPNHIHAIIVLSPGSAPVGAGPRACPPSACSARDNVNPEEGQPRGVAPTNTPRLSLADVVHRFKSLTTNRYADGVKHHGWSPPVPSGRMTVFPGVKRSRLSHCIMEPRQDLRPRGE
jgi:putative transposase